MNTLPKAVDTKKEYRLERLIDDILTEEGPEYSDEISVLDPRSVWHTSFHRTPQLREIAEEVDDLLDDGYRSLELGSGPGGWTHNIALQPGSETALGIEIEPELVETSRAVKEKCIDDGIYGRSDAYFLQGDAADPQVGIEVFDVVYANFPKRDPMAEEYIEKISETADEGTLVVAPDGGSPQKYLEPTGTKSLYRV